jgi:hypothetical protein
VRVGFEQVGKRAARAQLAQDQLHRIRVPLMHGLPIITAAGPVKMQACAMRLFAFIELEITVE